MKKIILFFTLIINGLAYSQTTPNIEKVLKAGNDANGKQIKDLADPTLAQDAATKAYVDALSPLTTRGDILTRGVTNNIRLGIGSAGKILISDGTDLAYSTATYPLTIGASEVPYATSANVIGSSSDFRYNGNGISLGTNAATVNIPFWISRDQTGAVSNRIANIHTGTSSLVEFYLENSASNIKMRKYSSGFTPSGTITANAGAIVNSAGDLLILSAAGSNMVFGTTSTEYAKFNSSGKFESTTGIAPDGGGLKHARVTTGSVSAGATALVTITWSTAFSDASYTVSASVLDATTSAASLSVVHIESITSSAVTVRVLNNAAGSLTGTIHVIAIHD